MLLLIDLQISEKQRSLYEALEKQQHYQGSLQSISSKMETLESKLSEPLEADKSPDSHMKVHEVSPVYYLLHYSLSIMSDREYLVVIQDSSNFS